MGMGVTRDRRPFYVVVRNVWTGQTECKRFSTASARDRFISTAPRSLAIRGHN